MAKNDFFRHFSSNLFIFLHPNSHKIYNFWGFLCSPDPTRRAGPDLAKIRKFGGFGPFFEFLRFPDDLCRPWSTPRSSRYRGGSQNRKNGILETTQISKNPKNRKIWVFRTFFGVFEISRRPLSTSVDPRTVPLARGLSKSQNLGPRDGKNRQNGPKCRKIDQNRPKSRKFLSPRV